ncbi:MAG: DUF1298 domain-containing protein [Actinomycetales bacterium]|nr:DUF1298 domain-containing protein [Actinomycetales bacterium]
MQQLTGLDEMFLSLDTGRTTGHVAGIAFFDKRAEPRDEVAFLRARVADRLTRLPVLRWRLHGAPLGIDGRYWVDGPVDLHEHVVGIRLPRPGTQAQLHAVIDKIMGTLLPRDLPMWRIFVIEGLEDGRFVYVIKMTHGLADGSVLWMLFDQLSDHPSEELPEVPMSAEPRGGGAEMFARGLLGLMNKPAKGLRLQADAIKWAAGKLRSDGPGFVPDSLARIVPGELSKPITALANKRRGPGEPKVGPFLPSLAPPMSPFNGTVTANLGLVYYDFALADLRKVGKIVGGTINDAALAITAGALRAYMAENGGIIDRPLITSTPVSWRSGDEKERFANHIFMLFQPLATHLADPMERLKFARETALSAKANWDGLPTHLTRRASEWMPSFTLGPMMKVMSFIPGQYVPKTFNVSVSNVKGPKDKPFYGGAEMQRYVVYGFLSTGSGLLIGGQSLGDRMVFSATICKDIVTHYEDLPRHLHDALAELLALAD